MKTLKQWEKSGLDLEDFIHPGDWISEDLYNYIGEIVCPYYCSKDLIQGGDPIKSEDGVLFLCVVINVLTYVNQNRNHLAVLDFST